jgi:hypothetical protein
MIFKKATKRKQQDEPTLENENGKSPNLLVEGISRECNMIAQKKQLNSVSYARTFQTPINVNEQRLTAMIDSGATGNFMSRTLVDRKGFSTRKKNDGYDLVVIDDSPLLSEDERVSEETTPLSIATQRHHEELIFDIVRMITHDIVLGMP